MNETATETKKQQTAKNGAAPSNGGDLLSQINIGSTEGFQNLSNEVDLYYVPEYPKDSGNGNPVRGIVLEMRERKPEPLDAKRPELGMKEPSRFYLLRSTGRFIVAYKDENDKKAYRLCEPGEIVWVDERHALKQLEGFMPKLVRGQTVAAEICFVPKKKVNLGGGRTVWKGQLSGQVVKPEVCKAIGISAELDVMQMGDAQTRALPPASGGSDEDIPF